MTANLGELERATLEEHQEWLRRLRERRHKATSLTRTLVANHTADIIQRQQRLEEEEEEKSRKISLAAGVAQEERESSQMRSSARCDCDERTDAVDDQAGEAVETEGGHLSVLQGGENDDDERLAHATKNNRRKSNNAEEEEQEESVGSTITAEGTTTRDGGYVDNGRSPSQQYDQQKSDQHICNDDDGGGGSDADDVVVAPPPLDDLEAKLLAGLADVEASCSSGIKKWIEEVRGRAQKIHRACSVKAATDDRDEWEKTELELANLELALRAAKQEVDNDAPGSCGGKFLLLPNEDATVDGGEAAAALNATETAAGPRILDGARGAETQSPETVVKPTTPGFIVEEKKECSALWSSFERLLVALQLDLEATSPVQAKYKCEKEERAIDRTLLGLESDLVGELSETFSLSRKKDEVQSMIRAGSEELRLAFVLMSEERRAKKKAKALELKLARDERRRAEALNVEEAKLGTFLDGDGKERKAEETMMIADVFSDIAAGGG